MCKEIKFKKFVNKQFDQLENQLENSEVSEIKLMLAEDDNFRASRAEQKMNRANRRKSGTAKKYRLGRQWQYADEQIDAYWVEKDGDKKITHWVADPQELKKLTIEEYWKYWNDIPWHKVKGINPKNCGYSEYRRWGKSLELAKQRVTGKKICRNYDDNFMTMEDDDQREKNQKKDHEFFVEYARKRYGFQRCEDGYLLEDGVDSAMFFNKLYSRTELHKKLLAAEWEVDRFRKARIKEINRQKHALLLEYTDKIDELNKELRKLMRMGI